MLVLHPVPDTVRADLCDEEDLSLAWHSQSYVTPVGHRRGIQGASKELRRGRGSQHERREQVSTRVTEIQAETRAYKGKCVCDVAGVWLLLNPVLPLPGCVTLDK